MPKRAVPVVLLLCLAPAVARSQVPVGPEFAVNTYTTGFQNAPTVALQADGNFVVVWQGVGEGDSYGVFARRFNPSGVATTPGEVRLNSSTPDYQRLASIATATDGRLVVVWRNDTSDFSDYDVMARQFDAAGTPGPEFRVNTYTTGHQGPGSVAMAATGNFVVVWASPQDGSGKGLVGQRFDAAGQPQFGEFPVNSFTTGSQDAPSLAPLPGGGFVVVWTSEGQDGSAWGVFGQRFGSSGTPQGSEFQVNSSVTGYQWSPKVAADASGRFVAVWSTFGQGGSGDGVFGRLYDAAGAPQGSEFEVSVSTTASFNHPWVAKDANGDFVVVWARGTDVFGRRYAASGVPEGGEFQVNSYTSSPQGYPAVAFGANGTFVVAWTSLYQDGSAVGVFGQRFGRDLIFKDGVESGDMSAWSASATDSDHLTVSPRAALGGHSSWGLQADVQGTAGVYVQDDSPEGDDHYRARFYFDTQDFDPGEQEGHFRTRIFLAFAQSPQRRLAALVLKRQFGSYSLMGRARRDDNSQADTGFFPITPGEHSVEIDWKRSSGPNADDGSLELWVDDGPAGAASAVDNSRSGVDFVRLGALSVKTGAAGTLYLDEFESRRASYIGP